MIQTAEVRSYRLRPMTRELAQKVERSYAESLDLNERELHCPHCGRYVLTLYSDASGHLKSKCKFCKSVTVFNLGCFRRTKRGGSKRRL